MKWIQSKAKRKPNSADAPLDIIAKLRGIDEVDKFLNPTADELNDPYLIKNIEDASNRIIMAIKNNERIVLSYDADADGITATTVLRRYLGNYTDNVDFIYNERNHGHGINEQTGTYFIQDVIDENKMDRLHLNAININKIMDADLLIIVDSSTNDTSACKMIREEFETEIIILDHHAIEQDNPYALLVNPQQLGDEYPNKHLSGAGVVFKTIQVIEETLCEVDIWQYIDLVAVGMYGDMMRVDVLENRYIIMEGLRNMKNVGLVRILKGAKADMYRLNGDSIGFSIAPMINGVARLDNIILAIEIFMTDDDKIAKKLRLQMQKLNEKRKEIQKETVDRYMELVDASKKIIIVMDDNSSKGFNGLVSQQLSELYKRPAIVGRLHKGVLSGSFRSFGGFDLKQFLQDSCLVEEAMGHPQAGGISVKEENIEKLILYIEKNIPELNEKGKVAMYDFEINVEEVNDYIRVIERFNLVAGNGFPKISVRVNGITIEDVETIGKTQETRKFKTFDNIELIRFKVNENYASELSVFDIIDAIGELSVNEFYHFGLKQKIITSQVRVIDYKMSEN
jgi:single-stranded-DNA-specific exonuclease